MKILRRFANNRESKSLATKLRKKRFALFESLISSLPRPLKILDVGGTQIFWEKMGFIEKTDVEIVLLNISKVNVTYQNFKSVVGDARKMTGFKNKEFDVVFSNSVIEHVGNYYKQHQMAEEIKRVGKRFFIQTPNRYFPIEPHFLFPFFQFFPLQIRVWLITHFNLGWHEKTNNKQKAIEDANSIKLLNKKELSKLFPGANIYEEKFWGLTKSFVLYNGWNAISHKKNKVYPSIFLSLSPNTTNKKVT